MAEGTRTSLSRTEPDGNGATSLVAAPTLKSYLPGVEPDRRLNDWGRSERIEGALDATLVEFLCRYWFRAEVEGMEHVPATGGAMLVSNHSGALPPDATMIGKAIREEHGGGVVGPRLPEPRTDREGLGRGIEDLDRERGPGFRGPVR